MNSKIKKQNESNVVLENPKLVCKDLLRVFTIQCSYVSFAFDDASAFYDYSVTNHPLC